jgi:hypothetical protein
LPNEIGYPHHFAHAFTLRLISNTVQKAFDATDKEGRTYQIKSRLVEDIDETPSFNFANITVPFDYLVCIFFHYGSSC